MHVAHALHSSPCSFTLFVIGNDSGFALLLIILTAGIDIFLSGLIIHKRNHDIGMADILSLIPAEHLVAVLKADQTLTPEQLIHSVIVEIQNRTQMAGTRSAVIIRDLDVPKLLHTGSITLQIHVPVSSLCGHQNRFAVHISASNKEAVRM